MDFYLGFGVPIHGLGGRGIGVIRGIEPGAAFGGQKGDQIIHDAGAGRTMQLPTLAALFDQTGSGQPGDMVRQGGCRNL